MVRTLLRLWLVLAVGACVSFGATDGDGADGGITDGGSGAEGATGDAPSDAPGRTDAPSGAGSSCEGLPQSCGASKAESCCASSLVVGGTFKRGGDNQEEASVSDFRLDDYEVTVGRFRKFVGAASMGYLPPGGAGKHTHLNGGMGLAASGGGFESGWESVWNTEIHGSKASWNGTGALNCTASYTTWTAEPELSETRPINCVNWFQAYAFCIWDGGFLPSEAEWNYAAAGGSEQRPYPWGAGIDHDHAIYDCQYNGLGTCASVSNIAPVGTLSAGKGKWGQSDLAGNLHEWTLDWYASPYVAPCVDCLNATPPTVQPPPPGRVVRGGAFFTGGATLANANRLSTVPTLRLYGFGFRCARSP